MAELVKNRDPGSIQPNSVRLSGSIEVGAAGAITSQTGNRACGVTWRKNATGDYRATLHKSYRKWMKGNAGISVAALATVPTLAAGNMVSFAGVTPAMIAGTAGVGAAEVIGLVTYRSDTNALADPTSGSFINWEMTLSESV
jgi:hypothetical protein